VLLFYSFGLFSLNTNYCLLLIGKLSVLNWIFSKMLKDFFRSPKGYTSETTFTLFYFFFTDSIYIFYLLILLRWVLSSFEIDDLKFWVLQVILSLFCLILLSTLSKQWLQTSGLLCLLLYELWSLVVTQVRFLTDNGRGVRWLLNTSV